MGMLADDAALLGSETEARVAELTRANERLIEQLARRDVKIRTQDSALKRLVAERDKAAEEANYVEELLAGNARPPKWMTPKRRRKGDNHATVGLMLSDLHLDETVLPAEMRWVNAFNREIAEQRFARVIESTVLLTSEYFSNLTYDGCVCLWAGDVFSGIIHEELRETNNAKSMMESLHYWEPIVAGAFDRLASHYGRLHVPVCVGNHGRSTIKWRAKGRATDSYEWLFAHNIARHHFAGSKTVTFDIPESYDTNVNVYNHRLHLEHGDNFHGGSGISGAMAPLLLGVHRTTRQAISEERMFQEPDLSKWQPTIEAASAMMVGGEPRSFDVMAIGHWHQYAVIPSKGLIINGSLKGYDEYARGKKFDPELAQQAMWLWTPEHGITFAAPIIAQKRALEGW